MMLVLKGSNENNLSKPLEVASALLICIAGVSHGVSPALNLKKL